MVVSDYSATQGLMALYIALTKELQQDRYQKIVDQAHNLIGPNIPAAVVDYNVGTQINLFGSYPTRADIARLSYLQLYSV